ncbi:uncharacterized protein LOC122066689 [Macadamia integrifolia]|uniref:uncharacterized protein LOC122066689 n=1 Tax=Macadamia integrifolia TaxID=60698 RepID=UPI001C4EA76C|nr:uncharacterized protein LOC122066689 [Macadamia integrifolia]
MEHEDFVRVVALSWSEWVSGSPILVLTSKLKRLKRDLKSWVRTAFPNLDEDLECAKKTLSQIHDQITSKGMNDHLFALEADAKTGLVKALKNHEKIWAEKARIRWLKAGDRNSNFFHLLVKMRSNKNTFRALKKPDGTIVEGHNQIEEYIMDFYERFHRVAPTSNHEDLLDNIPKVLNQMDCYKMDYIPGNEEIRRAAWELDLDSSPGPDGFSGAFFCKCWDMVEVEVCNTVRQFFGTGSMPNGANNNFLVLIPKVDGANTLDRFRPLCIGNFFCKIISKVIAMRLETLLPRLIPEEESAFQKGKMIHDNISVASVIANLMFSASKGGGLGLKIDIRKAYDTISWSFIFQRVVKPGSEQESPTDQWPKRLQPISGPRGVTTPGHILFTDDIFIFTNASLRYVNALKAFLMKYQDFSGQCISLKKSKLFLGKIALARKETIADTLGIQICTFQTHYLGVEIFKGRVKKEALLPVMDKVKGRLAGWKGNLLSLAGRTELVRSVIVGIPNHSFAIYWWPSSLLSIMERWMRNFIWTRETETSRKITVKWDSLCKPKEEGSLDIRRLRDTNKAMLCKLA